MIHHRLRGLQKSTGVNVADVFATSLYNGNGSTQTITNGIDLAGEGGLVWIKDRDSGAKGHGLYDTERGVNKRLQSQTAGAQLSATELLTAFNADGFTLGSDTDANGSETTYVAWTFRKAPKFFDVVTYTGNGANRTIAHSLGSVPGMIFIKQTSGSGGTWWVYHRSLGETKALGLNETAAQYTSVDLWNSSSPTDSVFSIGSNGNVNANTESFVSYLFAHDLDGVIQCGSYTGNGSTTGPTVTLGWEPQYLLIKNSSATSNWVVYDSSRDTSNPRTYKLFPNLADAEDTAGEDIDFTSTGFQPKSTDATINANTNTYIYMAIKKAS